MLNRLHPLLRIAAHLLVVAIFSLLIPAAQAATIFDNFNVGGVSNGPSAPAVFSISSPASITGVLTYHYNGARGSTPGTISLKHSDGTVYGPWTATGSAAPNLNWYWNVYPNVVIKAGNYTVLDSGTATWSYNSTSGNAGFVIVSGDVVTASAPGIPTNVTATAGNGSITVSFTPGSLGSGTLVNYWAACGVDATHIIKASGSSSPITVAGFTNGTAYYCWAIAETTVGYSSGWSANTPALTPMATTYAITTVASPAAGGGVTCNPNPVASGGSSTCTASANSGYTFAGWSGNCTGSTSPCTLDNVTALKSVTANFSPTTSGQAFDVVASASGNTSNLTLDLALYVNSADIGTQGSIYIGAQLPTGEWFINNSTNWVNWTGGNIPPYFTGALSTSKTLPILRNTDARSLANIALYAGYGRDSIDMLTRGNVKLAYTVPSDTFASQPLVPGTSTSEIKSVTTSAGHISKIQLTDGTSLTLPAATNVVTANLERKSNSLNLGSYGVATSGAMRELVISSSDAMPETYSLDLILPASEYGAINPDTIHIARVGDLSIDGQVVNGAVIFLPVRRDSGGALWVTDSYLPSAVAASRSQARSSTSASSFKIQYVIVTFQGNIDWSISPQLVRMVPNHMLVKRQPLSNLSADAQATEQGKCTKNIVVLVHGHSEDEKDGYDGNPTIGAPWLFPYKQDVWTYLYDTFNDDYHYAANASCTVFYEYIYPSFRPIFSGGGNLSDDLAQKLSNELQPLITNGTKPNLFIVAHSMGGLVARAAIQKFPAELHTAFQKLVTWGSPHHGSVVSSVRYACGGPYKRIPISLMSTLLNFTSAKNYCISLQLDLPGARDLRWDKSRALALSDYYEIPPNNPPLGEPLHIDTAEYDLDNGPWIYSENTRLLNAGDYYRSGAPLNLLYQKKYGFLYGVTSKVASGTIGKGASVTRLMMSNPSTEYLKVGSKSILYGDSDGGVAVSSMTAEGVAGDLIYVDDIDHEEYFGAPTSAGDFKQIAKAQTTALATLANLNLGDHVYACPPAITTVAPASGDIGVTVTIIGTGFGSTKDTVTFNGTVATITSWTPTQINTTVPAGAISGNVVVKVGDVSSNAKPFTVTSTTPPPGKFTISVNLSGKGYGGAFSTPWGIGCGQNGETNYACTAAFNTGTEVVIGGTNYSTIERCSFSGTRGASCSCPAAIDPSCFKDITAHNRCTISVSVAEVNCQCSVDVVVYDSSGPHGGCDASDIGF